MAKRAVNKGAWTADEDRKLSQYVEMHGPNRWKSVAIKSGLNRCGKSCRLRWLNYLRPDIKRGNISHAEDDLILRLHRLLGNKWSLIARRLPGRTDNEIKNYWNAHLRKKANLMENLPASSIALSQHDWHYDDNDDDKAITSMGNSNKESIISGDDADELSSDEDEDEYEDGCSDLSTGRRSNGLDWVKTFLELEEEEEEPQN